MIFSMKLLNQRNYNNQGNQGNRGNHAYISRLVADGCLVVALKYRLGCLVATVANFLQGEWANCHCGEKYG